MAVKVSGSARNQDQRILVYRGISVAPVATPSEAKINSGHGEAAAFFSRLENLELCARGLGMLRNRCLRLAEAHHRANSALKPFQHKCSTILGGIRLSVSERRVVVKVTCPNCHESYDIHIVLPETAEAKPFTPSDISGRTMWIS